MMIAFGRALEEAMHEQDISFEQLAKVVPIKKVELKAIVEGRKEPSLQELASLAKTLHLNMNELLQIHVTSDPAMKLEEEMEIEINRIAREIPKAQRNRFVKAVKYLAECFEAPDESQNRK